MSQQASATSQGIVRLCESTLIRELEGETVLLDLVSEQYFSLDEVGAAVLAAILKEPSLDAAVEALRNDYEVDADELRADIKDLIVALTDAELIEANQPGT